MTDIDDQLIAVHVCKSCGAETERAKINPESIITGWVRCSHCGHEGEINVVIQTRLPKRPVESVKPDQS